MATSKVTYKGQLRTQSVHLKSGNEIITDAPVDNNGKGEAFSPTDTVATALASCMLTIMGIKANGMKVNIEGANAEVTKTMGVEPRRITKIDVVFDLPFSFDDKTKTILEKAAMTCPVLYSIHPDIKKNVVFNWK
ncbi:OsmC family protein [Pseudofulvibacter geojedonensis]|uniref:OsmC family protein n=1 Tax=Pseudofulvibacter geojedonensis TaxID=1123758 RepID=A0ABW3I5V0_9FLAO